MLLVQFLLEYCSSHDSFGREIVNFESSYECVHKNMHTHTHTNIMLIYHTLLCMHMHTRHMYCVDTYVRNLEHNCTQLNPP